MDSWLGLVGTILAAAAGGGTVAAIINYFQQRPKLTAEAEDIYSRRKSRERREDHRERAMLRAEAELIEYKFDNLLDACGSLLDQVQHCPGVDVSQVRTKVLEIKYLDRIPGRPAPGDLLVEGEPQ
ncbi:hypothetical protein SEA_VASANTI_22 [Gordonia phage Vasanti]|uniref:Uncharacterized protein n=1 Tax=Gordonia phage Vasanti TaxID=2502431 RepID=A0A411BVX6_9CAUD|nr:membrane protein [Gordonia phage Vasanti]QAY05760.1 hypothetical protein SEA_VASANTI_22 [Gordonia phage Vasanti]